MYLAVHFEQMSNNSVFVKYNRTFRLPSIIVDKLEDLSSEYNLSVNKIVIQCIEYALNDMKHQNNDNVSDNTSNDII